MSDSGLFFGSLLVAAVGAILRWGVADSVDGLNLTSIGTIVLIAGVIGALAGLVRMFTRRRDVVAYDHAVAPREVVTERRDPIV
jgi:hypothetical protein